MMSEFMEEEVENLIEIDHFIGQSSDGRNYLNLCDLRLKSIPRAVFERDDITTLFLSSNLLLEIPAEIEKLQNLEVVTLDCNTVTELPPELCSLKKYETFSGFEHILILCWHFYVYVILSPSSILDTHFCSELHDTLFLIQDRTNSADQTIQG